MSKKNERVQKLIALDTMLTQQHRVPNGSAKFSKKQLDAAHQVIVDVLKLDNIVAAN